MTDKIHEALVLAQSALKRWTEKYGHLQNECGQVVSRKLDYILPPADHLRALEAIAEALPEYAALRETLAKIGAERGRYVHGAMETGLRAALREMVDAHVGLIQANGIDNIREAERRMKRAVELACVTLNAPQTISKSE